MKRWYHREARKELREAVFYYEDQRTGLGSVFLTTVRDRPTSANPMYRQKGLDTITDRS